MSKLSKATKLAKGVYRGVLAEDYDGRSKKVLVSASQGSTSSAYANVLFEKTSTLEAGAPVLLKQINGQVYVVSGGGRLGRLCEDFDRNVDNVAITASTVDEDGTDVWGDSPHEGEWSWQAVTVTNPAPGNDVAGIDANGAYVIAGGSNRDIYVETPENAIVIDYAFDLYLRVRSKSLGNEKLNIKLDSSEDDSSANVRVSLHFDRTGGYQILTKLTDSTLIPFNFVAGVWYWVRIGYYPGDSVGVSIWQDTGDEDDEPETYLYELNEEDGAYIPEEINKFQLQFMNIDTSDKITISSMRINGHCTEWTLGNPRAGEPCDPIDAHITYCCGFEEGGYTDNGFGAGSHDYSDGGGGQGISFESPGRTSESRYACRINGGGNIKVPLTNGGRIRIGSGWVKRNASSGVFLMMNWSSDSIGVLGFNSNGTVYADAGGGAGSTSQAFAIGEWVNVEWYYNTTQNPAVLKWRVNGQDQTDRTYSVAPFDLGPYEYWPIGGDVTYDDFVFSLTPSDYPLGPYTVRGGYAVADGAHNVAGGNWINEDSVSITNGTTDAWQHVDPSLIGAVWVRPNSADGSSYLEFVPKQHSTSGDRPVAVYAAVVTEKQGIIGDNYFEFRIRVDGADSTVYAGSGQWNIDKVNYLHYMNKPNGNQWDLPSINAMRYRLGYSSDNGPNNHYWGVMTEQAFKDGSACDSIAPCEAGPAPTFFCGYEHRDIPGTNYDGHHGETKQGSGGTHVVTDIVRSGGRAIRLTGGSSGSFLQRSLSGTAYVGRFYLYIEQINSGQGTDIWLLALAAGSNPTLRIEDNLTITAKIGTTTTSLPALSLNTWYRFDVYYDCSTNPHVLKWSIDGVAGTLSHAQAATTISNRQTGLHSNNSNIVRLDDVMESATLSHYPFGDGRVEPCLANGDGVHNVGSGDFHGDDGTLFSNSTTDAWTRLSFGTSGSSPRCEQRADLNNVYLEFTTEPVGGTRILGVYACSSLGWPGSGQSTYCEAHLVSGVTDTAFFTGDPGPSINGPVQHDSAIMTTDPNTGAPWEVDAVNAARLRFGWGTDSTPDNYCFNMHLEVAVDDACSDGAPL